MYYPVDTMTTLQYCKRSKRKLISKHERKRNELLAQIKKIELEEKKKIRDIGILNYQYVAMTIVDCFDVEGMVILTLVNRQFSKNFRNTPKFKLYAKLFFKDVAKCYCKYIKKKPEIKLKSLSKYSQITKTTSRSADKNKKHIYQEEKYSEFIQKDECDLSIDNKEFKKCKKCGQQGKGCIKDKQGCWKCILPEESDDDDPFSDFKYRDGY